MWYLLVALVIPLVSSHPEISIYQQHPSRTVLYEGQQTTVECRSEDSTKPLRIYNGTQSVKCQHSSEGNQDLCVFYGVFSRYDNGIVWRCREGAADDVVTAHVSFATTAITMTDKPDSRVAAGSAIVVKCVTDSANPAAHIEWIVHGAVIQGNSMYSVRSSYERGDFNADRTASTLSFSASTVQEGSTFTCRVRGHESLRVESTGFSLKSRISVVISGYTGPVAKGSTVQLQCSSAYGASFHWYNGQRVELGSQYGLSITVSQSATYTCTADTGWGYGEAQVRVDVLEPSSTPGTSTSTTTAATTTTTTTTATTTTTTARATKGTTNKLATKGTTNEATTKGTAATTTTTSTTTTDVPSSTDPSVKSSVSPTVSPKSASSTGRDPLSTSTTVATMVPAEKSMTTLLAGGVGGAVFMLLLVVLVVVFVRKRKQGLVMV